MTAPGHPDRLFWYFAGLMDPHEAQEVREHLSACEDCQSIARALKSLNARIEERGPGAHPRAESLDAYLRADSESSTVQRDVIEAHLSRCAACRDDLEALRRTYAAVPGVLDGKRVRTRRSIYRWGLAACLAVAVLAPAVWWLSGARTQPITLMPAQRSGARSAVLPGSGPWRVLVVPPSQAPTGRYSIWIEDEDQSVVARLPAGQAEKAGARLVVDMPALVAPGIYRLAVLPSGAGIDTPEYYPFMVATDQDN